MSRNIIKDMTQSSLVAIYLLPLLDMNMVTFGMNNFLDCLITQDGRFILVKVADLHEKEDAYHNPHYVHSLQTGKGEKFIIFSFPPKWRHTFEMFCEGKYSRFTKKAKETITSNSGLNWKTPNEQGKLINDARLLALYKTGELKNLIEDQLGVVLDDDSELLGPPKPEVFLTDPELDTMLRHMKYPSL